MNLTKLFNFKYFKENVKKSKAIIILSLLVLPFFTVLQLMNQKYINVFEFFDLAPLNMIFNIIVPFMLSLSLFGYVYDKKSVDFIGSMPISKKTIYTTNTIGGIVLIVLSQFLTFILSLIVSSFIKPIIFPQLILDTFLYQTVSYIFAFSVSNLAMSMVGNRMTQIALTILLVSLFPFINVYITEIAGAGVNLTSDYIYSIHKEYDYFITPLSVMFTESFSAYAVIKTIILSVVYSIIGGFVFVKRKLEKAGESFLTERNHLIVKGLTLIPFIVITKEAFSYGDFSEICLCFGIILVYWIMYDLLTSKKIKLLKSASALVISFITLLALLVVSIKIEECRYNNYGIDNVKYIQINNTQYYNSNSLGRNKERATYKITNREDIEKIFELYDSRRKKASMLYYEENGEKYDYFRISMNAYMNRNTYANFVVYLEESEYSQILANAEKTDKNYPIDGAKLINIPKLISKEEEDKLKNLLKEEDANNGSYGYFLTIQAGSNFYEEIHIARYRNHSVEKYYYRIDKSKHEIMKILNDLRIREITQGNETFTYVEIYDIDNNEIQYQPVKSDANKLRYETYVKNKLKNYETDFSKDIYCLSIEYNTKANGDFLRTRIYVNEDFINDLFENYNMKIIEAEKYDTYYYEKMMENPEIFVDDNMENIVIIKENNI